MDKMWPSRIRAERLIAEARTLQDLIAQTGKQLNLNPKAVWKSSASELGAHNSLDNRISAGSFQQRLKVAERQGLTLREFEKHLA
jgi:hypothetical protein